MPVLFSYYNYCSQTCTPSITYDSNGFPIATKCSSAVNQQCIVGKGQKYFSNAEFIPNEGSLQSCYSGYTYCKVSSVLNMF